MKPHIILFNINYLILGIAYAVGCVQNLYDENSVFSQQFLNTEK